MAREKSEKTQLVTFRVPAASKQALVELAASMGTGVGSLLRALFEKCDSWPEDARQAVAARFTAADGLNLVCGSPCVTERPRQLVYRRSTGEHRRLCLALIDAMFPTSAAEPNVALPNAESQSKGAAE